MTPQKRIAVLAPFLMPFSPAGSQMLEIVRGLAEEYDFTVFGAQMDESLSKKVRFKKLFIPKLRPPLFTYLIMFMTL